MPTLEFKGKQHIYAHHLTVPYRPLVPDVDRSLNPGGADDNLNYPKSAWNRLAQSGDAAEGSQRRVDARQTEDLSNENSRND